MVQKDTQMLLREAIAALDTMQEKLDAAERYKNDPIAVIGIGCRLPGGVTGPDAFWTLLSDGTDAISEVPDDRWDIDAYYDPDPDAPGKMYTRHGGFIDSADTFDPLFFGISPREAKTLDPQQRLMLEVSWEALEHAGVDPGSLRESPTGVFVGIGGSDFSTMQLGANSDEQIDAYTGSGGGVCFAAGRVSFALGLQGPSTIVDTACSSSLLATHLACQSLRVGECTMALAGGVNLMLSPVKTIYLSRLKALSADGRSKAFDASADGFSRGEGCGVVVLKRLSDARRDGDTVLAVIRGSAVNQDGPSSGLTVPNGSAQSAVIQTALIAAGMQPEDISYLESHGTGTLLGDPIEMRALGTVFGKHRQPEQPLMVGSVKTNIGHLEAAAGIAGLIKLVLAINHRTIPPHLHFTSPNPLIDWEHLPVRIPTELTPWETDGGILNGGVSSFGLSGTNVHLIVSSAEHESAMKKAPRPMHLFCLSAKTAPALDALIANHTDWFAVHPDAYPGDVSRTLAVSRAGHHERLTVVAGSVEDAGRMLGEYAKGTPHPQILRGVTGTERVRTAFLFTGQGSQCPGMGRELYETASVFRDVINRCDEVLREMLPVPLLDVLYPTDGTSELIHQTAYTQPALFAIEYALAMLWRSWGVIPDAVMGHSIGEIVAACVAGVFTLEDGLRLVAARGKLMQALPANGGMAAVFADEAAVRRVLDRVPGQIDIAALNSAANTVISGEKNAVEQAVAAFGEAGIKSTPLTVSHAFHSSLMEPMLAEFATVTESIVCRVPTIPLVSNVTGAFWQNGEYPDSEYWVRHVREPVDFVAGFNALSTGRYTRIIETGPKSVLTSLARSMDSDGSCTFLPSLKAGAGDWMTMLGSLGKLYVHGAPISWDGFFNDTGYRTVSMPTYPFQRQRYWPDPPVHSNGVTTKSGSAGVLWGRRFHSPAVNSIIYETELSVAAFPYLGDHVVFGTVTVPAALYISMIMGAANELQGSDTCRIELLAVHEVLSIPDNSAVSCQIIFEPESEDGYRVRILSLDDTAAGDGDSWTEHASGVVRYIAPFPEQSEDIATLNDRLDKQVVTADYYALLQRTGVQFGPTFMRLDAIRTNGDEACARIHPVERQNGMRKVLHPAVLDAGLQLFGAILRDETGDDPDTFLPVGADAISFDAMSSDIRQCHVRIDRKVSTDDQVTGQITYLDDRGAVCAMIDGIRLKRIPTYPVYTADRIPVDRTLYRITWEENPVQPTLANGDAAGRWLIFADETGIGQRIAEALERHGGTCMLVRRGAALEQVSECLVTIDPNNAGHFGRLFPVLKEAHVFPDSGLIYCWGIDDHMPDNMDDSVTPDRATALRDLLMLVQHAAHEDVTAVPPLWVVTSQAQEVTSGEPVNPLQSALWGFGRVIAHERPIEWGGLIDLPESSADRDMALLVAQIGTARPDAHTAIRDGHRYHARFVRAEHNAPADCTLALDTGGTYLITGGMGGIGRKMLDLFVAHGAGTIILCGRRALSPDDEQFLAAYRARGCAVTYKCCDVAEADQVVSLFAEISETLPPLTGIVHAAGIIEDRFMLNDDWDRVSRVLAPKLTGAWNLHRASRSLDLSVFVLFSSVVSLLGSPGQGAYAAANASLDALAGLRRSEGLPVLNINWGAWDTIGMVMELTDRDRKRIDAQGITLLSPDDAVGIFATLLAVSDTIRENIAVLAIDWPSFARAFPEMAKTPFFEAFSVPEEAVADTGSSGLAADVLASVPNDRKERLTAYLLYQLSEILTIPESLIDRQQPITTFGFDSILAFELKNRIEKDLHVTVSISKLLQAEHVIALTEAVNALITDRTGTDPAQTVSRERTEVFEEGEI